MFLSGMGGPHRGPLPMGGPPPRMGGPPPPGMWGPEHRGPSAGPQPPPNIGPTRPPLFPAATSQVCNKASITGLCNFKANFVCTYTTHFAHDTTIWRAVSLVTCGCIHKKCM